MDIDDNVRLYLVRREAEHRYASFDYCYNYFQSFSDPGKLADSNNLQQSCLQVGFYLASWGMLRGSTFLLKKSLKFFAPLVRYIAQAPSSLWHIDVENYEDNLDPLINCYGQIERALSHGGSATPTLVTKVMLGVFGTVPAFDEYFKRGLKIWWREKASLLKVAEFYRDHQAAIDTHHATTFTLDFATGRPTRLHYPRAKIVDMVGFIEGSKQKEAAANS